MTLYTTTKKYCTIYQANYLQATLTNDTDIRLYLSNPGSADLTFGIGYRLAIKHKLNGDIKLKSSSVENQSSNQNSTLSNSTNLNCKDSFRYSLDTNFQQSKKLKLKIGTTYEDGSVGNDSRNPRIPVNLKVPGSNTINIL